MLSLTGNPLPENDMLEWTFNGGGIRSEGRIALGVDSISFTSVERGDAGNYTVLSSNVAGDSNRFEFVLEVFCKSC